MPAATAVVICPHCGRKNRIASGAEGIARCGNCLNTDEAPDVAGRYDVQGIPLLVLLRDGAEVDRRVGAHPEDALRAWLTQRVGGAPASPATA